MFDTKSNSFLNHPTAAKQPHGKKKDTLDQSRSKMSAIALI
jgi:hypothetical protein